MDHIEWDVYEEKSINERVDDDENASWEAAFMQGWHEAGHV